MKKHISIIGSCVSRQMFNCRPLKDIFDVDRYAYQIAAWDMFGQSLDINREDIYKNYTEQFTARMLWYDIDKVAISEVEAQNSEYLLIDLYINIAATVKKMRFNGKESYLQHSYDRLGPFLKFAADSGKYQGLDVVDMQFNEVDPTIVRAGYDKLIEWATTHFAEDKIIINIPSFSEKYFDLEGELKEYPKDAVAKRRLLLDAIKKQSMYLHERMPKSILFDLSNDNTVSQYGVFEDSSAPVPAYMHYTEEDYCRHAKMLLDLLGIVDSSEKVLSPIGYSAMEFKNLYLKERMSQKTSCVNIAPFVDINSYFKRIDDIKDFIIILTVKDEASNRISGFKNKSALGIKANIKWRDSYVAVIDKSRGVIYEKSSKEKITYDYAVNERMLHVESAGFDAGNVSIVRLDDNKQNISLNMRGINIVILNSTTLEVVDTANCDSFSDSELKVFSSYFATVKIKTQ